jgi:hypothetical protein
MGKRDKRQTPDDEEWWMGKEVPQTNEQQHPTPKKTWADIINRGGINVQIVIGNGNLGLTLLMNRRVERRGGAVWWLGKRNRVGERGVMGRGKDGPEMTPHGGNKGGTMEKDGRGRAEDRGEPSEVACVQAGYLDQTTRDGL